MSHVGGRILLYFVGDLWSLGRRRRLREEKKCSRYDKQQGNDHSL